MRSRALAIAALCVAAFAGCGGPSGHGAETDPEKGFDADALNTALGQELTALDLYVRAAPHLDPSARRLAVRLRSQEQEYVDAISKAIRGLGGDVEAEAEAEDGGPPSRGRGALRAALQIEGTALAYYVDSAPHLYSSAPRTLAAALAAGHAQHLVVLRQALGADLVGSIPHGFDIPPPE